MIAHLNLLPLSLQRGQLVRAGLRRWLVLWGTSVAVAVVACLIYRQEVISLEYEAAGLRAQSASLRRLKGESDQMQGRLCSLQSRESLLATAEASPSPFQLLGITSQCTQNGRQGVSVRQFELVQQTRPRPAARKPSPRTGIKGPQTGPADEEVMVVRLRGNAVSDRAIADFVKSLCESTTFQAVQLKSTTSVERRGFTAREYEIDCIL